MEKRRRGRPATGVTRHRTVRVPDHLWDAAKAKAAERGDRLSDVVRRGLERYLRDE